MNEPKLSRPASLVHMWVVYLLAIAASFAIGYFLPIDSPLVKAGVVDVIATVLIFGFSIAYNNSSMYDPYWSVAPIVFVGYWVQQGSGGEAINLRAVIVMALVALWGSRLTWNFLKHWRGMRHEDWRYADFRAKMPKLYWLISFTGFHMFPTVIVFAASVPIYYACTSNSPLGIIDFVAMGVTLAAIAIETIADAQMRAFVASGKADGTTFRGGLWAWSRHPNYFGEVLFWWGMFLFGLGASTQYRWAIFGPAGVTVLFLVVSLPLIEARMKKRRNDYEQVRKEISIFIPWFPKK